MIEELEQGRMKVQLEQEMMKDTAQRTVKKIQHLQKAKHKKIMTMMLMEMMEYAQRTVKKIQN